MGGYAQPQINAVNLIRTLSLGMGPLEAIAAPRWLVGGMDPDAEGGSFVVAEADVPEGTLDTLRRAGFGIEMVGEHDEALGHAHLIRADPDGLEAGSDPRADGGAMAG